MIKLNRGIAGAGAAAALVLGLAANAQAALIVDGSLTLNTDPALIYQQTESAPCVIGGSNCLNGAFPYTLQGPGGNGETDNVFSPVYTYAAIFGVTASNSFTIALDYNQSNDAQTLNLFEAIYCGAGGCTTQTFDIATLLQVNNNGVGYSDFLLLGFSIPAATQTIQFHANWFNNDGADRYFLVGANTPPVPEPASLSLFGLALLGVARRFVRRKA